MRVFSEAKLLLLLFSSFSTLTYVTFNPLFPYHGDPAFELHAASPLRSLIAPRHESTSDGVSAETPKQDLTALTTDTHATLLSATTDPDLTETKNNCLQFSGSNSLGL